jgi:hypothetical protein
MNDDLTPYRWQDYVITPRRSAANLVATVLIMIAVGGAAVLGASDRAPAPSGPVAHATEREPCLALIARPPLPSHRVKHLL